MMPMQGRPKLYIGCSLTQAPEDFRNAVAGLKDQLRDEFEMLEFVGLVDGTPTSVYQWDIQECIAGCDLFVAICDLPAIGLGYELGAALEKFGKPTLAVAHEDTPVTRMLLGIDHPMYDFRRYRELDDVPAMIREKRTKHFPATVDTRPLGNAGALE